MDALGCPYNSRQDAMQRRALTAGVDENSRRSTISLLASSAAAREGGKGGGGVDVRECRW